ncbi:DegT/DnrJ/EryC1/StrS aminotransferase [Ammonifex degensii KC4]|uniref:DegT/DnrJ/EryC1/StrS aminotransferase n=1 Tax=Ammonifex degensii (strain DSM 10501 / KC4) TaxID=429009 RepID=C9R9Z8_AMMDK|nr:DegT/DnrJ/EryC1/StrS family aminotransferase [Ammonifex degensii]ACX53127.1 DegT/DnrJ/EryC1/StrS aminotransferase [Ammonifex degensii KC4]
MAAEVGQNSPVKRIPFNRPYLGSEEEEAVREVLREGRLEPGPRVRAFEERLASWLGVKYAVMVASGTAALHAALYAVGISRGDEVILSPLAPPEVGSAILYLGAKPVFADVNPETLTLDPEEVKRNLTPQTRALIVTHYAGLPADIGPLIKFAAENELVLIEDATCALGATYEGRPVGSFGQVAAFSFSPDSTLTTGTGGAVVTDDPEVYRWLRLFTSLGIVRSLADWVRKEGPWHFEVQEIGFDYRPGEIQGALGLVQLGRLEEMLTRRRELAARYLKALSSLPLRPVSYPPNSQPAWSFFPVRLDLEMLRAGREEIYPALWAEGVEVGVHYLPLYLHPLYGWIGDPNVCTLGQGPPCPRAEALYPELISLPLYPAMTNEEQEEVIAALSRVLLSRLKGN